MAGGAQTAFGVVGPLVPQGQPDPLAKQETKDPLDQQDLLDQPVLRVILVVILMVQPVKQDLLVKQVQ